MSAMKAKLFTLADALEMNMNVRGDGTLTGSAKIDLDLFQDYSPTIITSIEESLIDYVNNVIVVEGQIWGNLGFVCIVEDTKSRISFFVIDRSKRYKNKSPFGDRWSRQWTYQWLAKCCKAVYDRSVFDTEWDLLEGGPKKLKDYTKARADGAKAKEAYGIVWDA